MSRFGIAHVFPLLVFVLILHSPDVAWSFQAEQIADTGIRESFKDRLKAAAQGKPTDADSIEEEMTSAVGRQIELFIEQSLKTADQEAMATARQAGESTELVDCLVTMLSCELRNEPISDMESGFIRFTLDKLDVRINWDYSIAVGAIPPEKTAVRIRLPKLHPCGGCKKALESALDSTEGFENAMVDLETQTAEFLAGTDRNIETKLDELEQANIQQLSDWKLVRK